MKMKELANKNRLELLKELSEKRLSAKDLRFGIAGSKKKDVKEASKIRKDIARIMTALELESRKIKNSKK